MSARIRGLNKDNKGIWRADKRWGKRRFSKSFGRQSEAEAIQAYQRWWQRITGGGEQITLERAADIYYEARAMHQPSKDDTRRGLKRLEEFFGPTRLLSEIKHTEFQEYMGRRVRQVSPASANREGQLLKRVFRFCKAQTEIEWVWFPEPAPPDNPLPPSEEARLMAELVPHARPIVQFLLLTGVRRENGIQLMWEQIDWEQREINFRTKSKKPGGEIFSAPLIERRQPCCPVWESRMKDGCSSSGSAVNVMPVREDVDSRSRASPRRSRPPLGG